ncbi:class I SAM-dependent methyltransferase [Chondromyces apiculatus]|uniref:Phosphatidylethanolamine N-methyltransferase n=1 Tax=Chondromyces apiculatus DSM 436 TaxID=1192034 RepID=A0A017TDL3_9BACT|nr:class I SAM-dependent methyltransferase [Chondromyces apiculatus]EYF07383.1 phosphatidylethanolamine N-methyltransferase [Chondromyces apiculatus DSM 436]
MSQSQEISSRYDQVSSGYGRSPDDVTRRLYWLAYEHLTWRAIEENLPAGRRARVLDAGGGGGKYGARIAEQGHEVTVLDLSPGMLDEARRRFEAQGIGGTFVEGDILALPFADGTFDLVLCEGDPVSYCLERYPQAIRELVRVAAGGAPVLLGVDSRYEHFIGALRFGDKAKALVILQDGRSLCPYGLPVHAFTLPELHAAVSAAGADLVEISGKPVLFLEMLQAMMAAHGTSFEPWAARDEILALQERLSHEGFAVCGGHLQVVARKKRGTP